MQQQACLSSTSSSSGSNSGSRGSGSRGSSSRGSGSSSSSRGCGSSSRGSGSGMCSSNAVAAAASAAVIEGRRGGAFVCGPFGGPPPRIKRERGGGPPRLSRRPAAPSLSARFCLLLLLLLLFFSFVFFGCFPGGLGDCCVKPRQREVCLFGGCSFSVFCLFAALATSSPLSSAAADNRGERPRVFLVFVAAATGASLVCSVPEARLLPRLLTGGDPLLYIYILLRGTPLKRADPLLYTSAPPGGCDLPLCASRWANAPCERQVTLLRSSTTQTAFSVSSNTSSCACIRGRLILVSLRAPSSSCCSSSSRMSG
ncbi:hypothetical protein Efla_002957 [Eimeria flavescens]